MIRRHASLVLALLAASTACKTRSETPPPAVAPVTPSGNAAPAVAPPTTPTATATATTPPPAPVAEADPWAKPAVAKDPLPHPMFWSVEKDGKTTYFLGTIHMGIDVDARLPAMVWAKLDAATTFAMETDTSDPKLASDMSASVDTSLRTELGDAHWAKLEATVGPAVAASLDHKKPMIAATLLAMRGLPSTPFMDGVLLAHASTAHKQLVFLEPAAAELAVLEKWMDARAIRDLLDELDLADKNTQEMLAAYVAGDETRMLALSDGERAIFKKHGRTDREYDESMDDLLFRRNASWIPAIEKLHARGGGFIAVGAMHLIGKKSVLDLLGSKGYKVTRLTPPTP